MALQQNLFRLIPITILHRALQIRPMMAVQVRKYPVLILQSTICLLRRVILHCSEGAFLRWLMGSSN
jgi:hypothetical protein